MAIKRTFLILLILISTVFLVYQLWLVLAPLQCINLERKYFSLQDKYQVLKMQRLVLEQNYALQVVKTKFEHLKADKPSFSINKQVPTLSSISNIKEPVALSLQESKTFEQLEAYVSNNKPLAEQPLTNDEKDLLKVPSQNFTLQLMGVREAKELTHFISDNHLQDARIFHTYYLNKDWYVLISGNYKNHTEALKAIDGLPVAIKNLKPWIRQFSSVHKAIELYRG